MARPSTSSSSRPTREQKASFTPSNTPEASVTANGAGAVLATSRGISTSGDRGGCTPFLSCETPNPGKLSPVVSTDLLALVTLFRRHPCAIQPGSLGAKSVSTLTRAADISAPVGPDGGQDAYGIAQKELRIVSVYPGSRDLSSSGDKGSAAEAAGVRQGVRQEASRSCSRSARP